MNKFYYTCQFIIRLQLKKIVVSTLFPRNTIIILSVRYDGYIGMQKYEIAIL